MKALRFLPVIILFSMAGFAQNTRVDDIVFSRNGFPAPGAQVAVCSQVSITAASEVLSTVTITSTLNPPQGSTVTIVGVSPTQYNGAYTVLTTSGTNFTYSNPTQGLGAGTVFGSALVTSSTPCAPLAALCSSYTDTVCASPNPVTADGLGNYNLYIKPGHYTRQFYGSGLTARLQPDQILACDPTNCTITGGAATFTSVTTGSLTNNGNEVIAGPNPWVDVTAPAFAGGAKCNASALFDGVTTSGLTTVTSATGHWTAADVGKQISVVVTPYSNTGLITGTISAVNSATSINMTITAGTATNATGARVLYGTDDTAAIQAAITFAETFQKGGTSFYASNDVPAVYFPSPAGTIQFTSMGCVISGPITVNTQGVKLMAMGMESTTLIFNAAGAVINVTVPGGGGGRGSSGSFQMHNIAMTGNYVANNGIVVTDAQENDFSWDHIDNFLVFGVNLTTIGGQTDTLTRFYHMKMYGNACAIGINTSSNIDILSSGFFGQTGTASTLKGICLKGAGADIHIWGTWFEGLLDGIFYDNSAGTASYMVDVRSGRWLCTITEGRFLSASSQNVNNKIFVNAFFDNNEILTSNATHWADLLWNANVAVGTSMSVVWERNSRDSGLTGTLFNTDNAGTAIIYQNNNGVSGANISTGAGTVAGFDCGAELGIGATCTSRGNLTMLGALSGTGASNTFTNGVDCLTNGGCNAGSNHAFFNVVGSNLQSLGSINSTETTAPSAASGHDIFYGDSTAHCFEGSYNNGSFSCVPLVGSPQTWTALQNHTGGGGRASVGTSDFTSVNSAALQAITGLTFSLGSTAQVWSFHCSLMYSQGTASAGDQFGVGVITTAPTNVNVFGVAYTTTGAASAQATGNLLNLASTTPTAVVTFTPAVNATVYGASLDGTIETAGSGAATFNAYVLNGTAANVMVVKRGSYCDIF